MLKNTQFTAIIPARAGSKRLSNKNLIILDGKSLLAYSMDAAHNSKYVNNCLLTTNIPMNYLNDINKKCLVYQRPSCLTEDNSLMSDVVIDAIDFLDQKHQIKSEYIILLQPTSPLRTAKHIDQACELMLSAPDCESVISVFEPPSHPYKMFKVEKNNSLIPFKNISDLEKPKQTLPKIYAQNGAIYIIKTNAFKKHKSFYIEPCLPFVMSQTSSIDIDTMDDFKLAEFFLKNHNES